jgi:hypothetical protein
LEANLVLWHFLSFYEAVLGSSLVHALEHIAFFSAGIVLWLPVLEAPARAGVLGTGEARLHRRRPPRRDDHRQRLHLGRLAVLRTYRTGDDYLGLSPSADQSLAGSLMCSRARSSRSSR